jgi:cyclopropane fatty-acyl-phospholipid synthase-like methyltransferase
VGRKKPEYYDGLLVKADLGLHQQIAAAVEQTVPAGGRVLDLGAGAGALSARLRDLGYTVVAADVDQHSFQARGVEFVALDFDDVAAVRGFTEQHAGEFDAVLGIEVIEHVEDQWAYVRGLAAMVRPGGAVVLSTPNITSWLSRLHFLRTGRFHQFDDADLSYGHISPITSRSLRIVLERCGLTVQLMEPAGTLPPLYVGDRTSGLKSLLALPLRPFQHGMLDGWCVLTVATRARQDPPPGE